MLRRATVNNEERLGFTLAKRQSKRIKPTVITDCDFADDIVLLSNEIEQAQIFFKKVERETMKVGLHVNSEKTKFLALNQRVAPEIITADGTNIECVDDYKYLGSWIGSTEKDISIRKAIAMESLEQIVTNMEIFFKKALQDQSFQSNCRTNPAIRVRDLDAYK